LRLLEEHGLDGTIRLEELADLIIRHVGGEILNIDVVDELSHGGLVVSGLEHEGLDTGGEFVGFRSGKSFRGGIGLLEADESITIGVVLRGEGNLKRFNGTESFENFVEIFVKDVSGNLDENVVCEQFFLVGTEELLVESETSAWFAVDLEVSHLVTGSLVLIGILDVDHGGVERSGDVLFDLRLLFRIS